MQKGPIKSLDLVIHPAQRCIALRILVTPQQATCEKRNKRQGDQERGNHGSDNGDKEGSCVGSGPSRQKQQGYKRKNQHKGRADDCCPNLERGIDGGFGPRLAHPQMSCDILRHHDAVIDQQAQSNNEAGDRKLAHVEASGIKHQQAGCERERDRNHHDRGRAQAQRQQREHHQYDRNGKIAGEFVQTPLHIPALVKLHHQLDIRWQDRLLPLQFTVQLLFEPGDINPVLLRHCQEDGPLAIMAGAVNLFFGPPFDLGDIPDGQERSVGCPKREAPYRVQLPIGTSCLDVQSPLPALDGAAGQFGSPLPYGIGNRARSNAELGQLLGIDFHTYFRLR